MVHWLWFSVGFAEIGIELKLAAIIGTWSTSDLRLGSQRLTTMDFVVNYGISETLQGYVLF